jgi:hypothetical protein
MEREKRACLTSAVKEDISNCLRQMQFCLQSAGTSLDAPGTASKCDRGHNRRPLGGRTVLPVTRAPRQAS